MTRAFLTAEWRNLAMLNYAVDPALLTPFVPRGTVLDSWDGRTYMSLVGFLFADTRVLGVPIPFHRAFEEVNLRFYVRRTSVEYEWKLRGEWCGLRVETPGPPRAIEPGSEEEFIAEHYWGYTRQRDGSTVEYQVVHPPWKVSAVSHASVVGELAELYGDALAAKLAEPPDSAFLADGSAISVSLPRHLTSDDLSRPENH